MLCMVIPSKTEPPGLLQYRLIVSTLPSESSSFLNVCAECSPSSSHAYFVISPYKKTSPVLPSADAFISKNLLCFFLLFTVIPPFNCSRCGLSFIDRKSTRLNSSHVSISYAVFCLKKKGLSMQDDHDRRNGELRR